MRRVVGIGAVVGLLLVVVVAASGQGIARFDPPALESWSASPPDPGLMPSQAASPLPRDLSTDDTGAHIVSTILMVIGAAVLIVLLFFVIRAILRAWAARIPLREAEAPGEESFTAAEEPDPEHTAPVIRRGIASALRVIDEHPDPADAIIAAWIGLEESASDAGIIRGRSETPAEFTLRVVTRRAETGDDARALLRLFERVRFGGAVADEADRAAARRSLAAIQEGWR